MFRTTLSTCILPSSQGKHVHHPHRENFCMEHKYNDWVLPTRPSLLCSSSLLNYFATNHNQTLDWLHSLNNEESQNSTGNVIQQRVGLPKSRVFVAYQRMRKMRSGSVPNFSTFPFSPPPCMIADMTRAQWRALQKLSSNTFLGDLLNAGTMTMHPHAKGCDDHYQT
eukprot:2392682-Ditylum_brightwellii.AAC.1